MNVAICNTHIYIQEDVCGWLLSEFRTSSHQQNTRKSYMDSVALLCFARPKVPVVPLWNFGMTWKRNLALWQRDTHTSQGRVASRSVLQRPSFPKTHLKGTLLGPVALQAPARVKQEETCR